MIDILEKINTERHIWVNNAKKQISFKQLEGEVCFKRTCFSLVEQLNQKKNGVIAEFKKGSPSKGIINDKVNVSEVTKGYELAGAAGISILTEPLFFNGNDHDLIVARPQITIPILRKDFIVDEYQIIESKSLGADVILLIASSLTTNQVKNFAKLAKGIGLEVLLEIHDEEELQHICDDIDIVGVNNRNLKTFEVNIETSLRLLPQIETSKICISESGLSSIEDIKLLSNAGFKGFLMGETFMKNEKPHEELKSFLKQLNN